jgi:hypothetical protein
MFYRICIALVAQKTSHRKILTVIATPTIQITETTKKAYAIGTSYEST